MLTINELMDVSVKRCEAQFGHKLHDWSLMEWAGAATFEFGEGGNLAKKIKRLDTNFGSMNKPKDRDREKLVDEMAEEIADGIMYAVLWAAAAGITDLETVIANKFNKVSMHNGSDIFL